MLPRVKINYINGQLGTVGESPDGLFALVCIATAVASTFALNTAYSVRNMEDLSVLGVTEENNPQLYKHVTDFYHEAEYGTELVVYGLAAGTKLATALNKDSGVIRQLLESKKGSLRGVFVSGAAETAGDDGIGADVVAAMPVAQALAEWSTTELYAPIFICLEGSGYAGGDVIDLSEKDYNRVCVLIGDTEASSGGACLGTLAGRLASIPVHRNCGRVKDGSLYPIEMFFVNVDVAQAGSQVADLNAKSYITPRTYVGRSGYYFSDDRMACDVTDDYSSLSRRRVIDKAYRIAYDTLLDMMLDEIEVNEDGTMQVGVIKAWQQAVANAVNRSMTAAGELSAGEDGEGCVCYINDQQNVLATGRIDVTLKVRPFAYARYIDVDLGFQVTA